MTTANDIINRALLMLGVRAAGETVSAEEAQDGFTAFVAMVGELLPPLLDVSVTQDFECRGGESLKVGSTVSSITITLPDAPRDGMRVQVTDVDAAFASRPVTVARNGRLLEGAAANQTLSTNGASVTWMYRGDTGSWERSAPLTLAGTLPYPTEFDQALAAVLACRIAPEYGREPTPRLLVMGDTGERQLRARYASADELAPDLALRMLPSQWGWRNTL